MNNIAIVDIETDLSWTQIWMAGIHYPALGRSTVTLNKQELREELSRNKTDTIVGHNLISFDLQRLSDIWKFNWTGVVEDTIVLGRLYHPSIEGGHSLKAWAQRAGKTLKDDFAVEDFDKGVSPEMISYCKTDCEATASVHQYIKSLLKADGFSQEAIDLEHTVAFLMTEQEQNGFCFDFDRACALHEDHQQRMTQIEDTLRELFKPIITERISEKTGKRLKDDVQVFNVGSRQQVAERLSGLGAVWKDKTPTGKPVVDDGSLKANEHIPEAQLVLEYMTLQKRLGMLTSWLNAYENDGRIHGSVNPCGAVTGRMTHNNPNMAQIPSDKMYRACFIPAKGRVLVGIDASQLELRCLAHYMKDEEYINEVISGDIHTTNQHAAGLSTRDAAKTFIYAFIYGAANARLGSILGGNTKDGKRAREKLLRNLPALSSLIDRVQRFAGNGSVPGIDGRRLRIRTAHAALNTLLQGCGAIIMKKALVLAMERLDRSRCKLVASVHDEYQFEADPDYAKDVGETVVQAIRDAGTELGLRCPMDGEFKIGNSWAETH